MPLRIARSRQRGIATNELGISAVILTILTVLMVQTLSCQTDKALECVTTAARIGDGVSPKDLQCPVSKKPFAQAMCPDSDPHLKWPPRFDRAGSQQDLPAPPQGATLEIGRTGSSIAARENGPTVIVDVRPRIWWRYIVGPILHLLSVLYIITLLVNLRPKDPHPPGVFVVILIAALASGWFLWVSVPTTEGSEAFQIDRAGSRVIHHRYLFGKELAPRVYEARGLAFVRSRTWPKTYSLVLAVRGSKAVELIDGLEEEDAVLGSWLRARIAK